MTQRGSASLELALGIGLLVFPAVIMVLAFAPWLEARAFVDAAASEGARAAVLSDGDPTGAGIAAIEPMAAARGFEAVQVEMCGGDSCSLQRGSFVTAEVVVEIPLIVTPWGPVGGVEVSGFHAEPVDAYRSLP